MIYKIFTVILAVICGVLSYNLHIQYHTKEQLLNETKQLQFKLKELDQNLKDTTKDLDDLTILKKELKISDIEHIEHIADIEHKEAEKHLGESFYYVDVKCTAYSAGDGLTPSTTMANGEEVYVGAVAYNDVPLGTKLEIDGIVYTVCDRVGSDGVVDIYMNTIDECFDFGVQYKTIKVYNE